MKVSFVPNVSRGRGGSFPQPAKKASLCPASSMATQEIFPERPKKQVCAQPAKKASLCPTHPVATKQIFSNQTRKQVCAQSAPQPQRKFSPTGQESKFVPSQLRSHKAKETRFAKQISSLISGRQMLIRTSAKNKLLPITSDQILRHP